MLKAIEKTLILLCKIIATLFIPTIIIQFLALGEQFNESKMIAIVSAIIFLIPFSLFLIIGFLYLIYFLWE